MQKLKAELNSIHEYVKLIEERFTQFLEGTISRPELIEQLFIIEGQVSASIHLAYMSLPKEEEVEINFNFPPMSETTLCEPGLSQRLSNQGDPPSNSHVHNRVLLCCPPVGSNEDTIIAWVRRYKPDLDNIECIEAHRIYRLYRERGKTGEEALKIANLV
jgi:hypothetical protein